MRVPHDLAAEFMWPGAAGSRLEYLCLTGDQEGIRDCLLKHRDRDEPSGIFSAFADHLDDPGAAIKALSRTSIEIPRRERVEYYERHLEWQGRKST